MTKTKTINLTELVEMYTRELYSRAVHKVSDAELAKDLVQDTFLAAVEKMDTFRGDSLPKTWLISILNHKIIDVYRKKVNQPLNIDDRVFSKYFDEEGNWQEAKRPDRNGLKTGRKMRATYWMMPNFKRSCKNASMLFLKNGAYA